MEHDISTMDYKSLLKLTQQDNKEESNKLRLFYKIHESQLINIDFVSSNQKYAPPLPVFYNKQTGYCYMDTGYINYLKSYPRAKDELINAKNFSNLSKITLISYNDLNQITEAETAFSIQQDYLRANEISSTQKQKEKKVEPKKEETLTL